MFLNVTGSVGRGADRDGRAAVFGTYWLVKKLLKLIALQRLNFDQRFGDGVQLGTLFLQDIHGALEGFLHELPDLQVDLLGDAL